MILRAGILKSDLKPFRGRKKMYFTAACKNVQRYQSSQFIKENLKDGLTAVYEHFQREKIWASTGL